MGLDAIKKAISKTVTTVQEVNELQELLRSMEGFYRNHDAWVSKLRSGDRLRDWHGNEYEFLKCSGTTRSDFAAQVKCGDGSTETLTYGDFRKRSIWCGRAQAEHLLTHNTDCQKAWEWAQHLKPGDMVFNWCREINAVVEVHPESCTVDLKGEDGEIRGESMLGFANFEFKKAEPEEQPALAQLVDQMWREGLIDGDD